MGTTGRWMVTGVGVWDVKESTDMLVLPVYALGRSRRKVCVAATR